MRGRIIYSLSEDQEVGIYLYLFVKRFLYDPIMTKLPAIKTRPQVWLYDIWETSKRGRGRNSKNVATRMDNNRRRMNGKREGKSKVCCFWWLAQVDLSCPGESERVSVVGELKGGEGRQYNERNQPPGGISQSTFGRRWERSCRRVVRNKVK